MRAGPGVNIERVGGGIIAPASPRPGDEQSHGVPDLQRPVGEAVVGQRRTLRVVHTRPWIRAAQRGDDSRSTVGVPNTLEPRLISPDRVEPGDALGVFCGPIRTSARQSATLIVNCGASAAAAHSDCCDYFRDHVTGTAVSRAEPHEL